MKPIRTLHQHRAALRRLEAIIDAKPKTALANEAEILFVLISDYERRVHPIPAPHPLAAIKYRMMQLGLSQSDMIPYFGTGSRVSEVLNGKRQLTVKMIASLHYGLGIPFESLIMISSGLARRFGKLRHDPVARLAALRLQLGPKRKPGRPRKKQPAGGLTGTPRTVSKKAGDGLDAAEAKRLKLLLKEWREKERNRKAPPRAKEKPAPKPKTKPVAARPKKAAAEKTKPAQQAQRIIRLPEKRK